MQHIPSCCSSLLLVVLVEQHGELLVVLLELPVGKLQLFVSVELLQHALSVVLVVVEVGRPRTVLLDHEHPVEV